MPLTSEHAAEVWDLFGSTPLFAKWPEARQDLAYRLDLEEVKAGGRIFDPGDSPECLYLVGAGIIRETLHHNNADTGTAWLELRHRAGDYFGQHALFAKSHESVAVAVENARLYRMGPIDLRYALERNPDLRDALLREELAGRLRKVPLFRSLEDDEIRRLAQAVKEATFSQGAGLPLRDRPGLWIVEWGHVGVTGPVNLRESLYRSDINQQTQTVSADAVAGRWCLTAGNFFLSSSADQPEPTRNLATTAIAALETRTLHLASEHVKRLVSEFRDVRELLVRPFDITVVLLGVREKEQAKLSIVEAVMGAGGNRALQTKRLLSGPELTAEHFRHLAQFAGWEFVPAGQNITTQGSVGHSFVVLRDGTAIVHAIDDSGRLRPRNALRPGDYYGETSLLEGRPRDASVRAEKGRVQATRSGPGGAEVIVLDRRDLQIAFAERPDLWHPGIPLFDRTVQVKEEKRLYEWQDEGETVIWHDRAHWWFLLKQELVLLASVIALLVILFFLFRVLPVAETAAQAFQAALPSIVLLAFIFVVGPIGAIIAINYFIDYYAVTNIRITRRDRQLLVYDLRTEAPINTVQDVNIRQWPLGRLLRFGDVSVSTAAKAGSIVFVNVPKPDSIQGQVLEGRAKAVASQRGQRKEILRRQLIGGLHMALPIQERVRPLGPGARLPSRRRWSLHRPHLGLGLPRGVQPQPGQIIWRKSWVNLVARAGLPFLAFLLLTLLFFISSGQGLFSSGTSGILNLKGTSVFLVWLFLWASATFWLWYQFMDWRNDVYIVTDDSLIDIEAKPLALSYQRREGRLDRVQTAFAAQKGFFANVLDYGDVQIMTAASDPGFTFFMVGHPRQVQAAIFQKLDAFRRRQDEQKARERQQDLLEGLEAYHELQGIR